MSGFQSQAILLLTDPSSQEFKVDGQKLRAEIETFMQTVGAKSEERRASELKASNSQDRGQAD